MQIADDYLYPSKCKRCRYATVHTKLVKLPFGTLGLFEQKIQRTNTLDAKVASAHWTRLTLIINNCLIPSTHSHM